MKVFIKHLVEMADHRASRGVELLWLIADASAFLVLVLAALTMSSYIFHYPPLHPSVFDDSPSMAFSTAFCFFWLALSALLQHRKH